MRSRKLLALALALLMVLSVLPAATWAAGGWDVEKDSGDCTEGGTHHWVGWYGPAPTCTEKGAISWVCQKCGMDAWEEVPALGHDWGPWTTISDATCTTDGEKVRYCNRCGIREVDKIPALGHDMHEQLTAQKDPTCTDDGYKEYTEVCSRCGMTGAAHADAIPALGHNWGEWKTHLEPTCEEPGKRHHTCKRCNWTENGNLAALGHDWDDGVVTKEPTPEAPGEMTYTCKRDPSHTYTVEIPYDGIPDPPLPPPVTVAPNPEPDPDPDIMKLELTATKTGLIKPAYQLGDPISFELRLKNMSDEDVENPYISEYWEENGHSFVNSYTATAVLAPGEEFVRDVTETIIGDDVANGQVTFSFFGMADKVSDGTNLVSNTAALTWLTEDTEPDPDENYALHLDVYHTIPKSEYIVDEYGDTEEIPFQLIVTNVGDMPLVFNSYTVSLNGVSYTVAVPSQYLKPTDSYSFTLSGTILNETQVKPGSGTATTLGIVTMSFTAHAVHPEWTDIGVCDSNTVSLDHTLVEPGPWTPDLADLTIAKAETSYHVNPKGYMLDDTITYAITVTNTGALDIPVVEIHDDLFDDGGGGNVLAVITNLAPAESRTVNFAYVVTQGDVDAKWVINNAMAEWVEPITGAPVTTPAIPVKSPTTDEPLPGGLVIVKSVIGGPDNGSYYTPGEKITFHVAVTNTMDVTITDIWIYDAFNAPVYIGILPAHDTFEWSYDYEATEMDAKILGYVSNIAYGWGFYDSTIINGTSNEVTVPVHFNPPKVPMLQLSKEEVSKPANGSYYVEGEIIDYVISAKNVGETVIYDVCLFDSLDSPPFEYAHFGVLYPDEQQSALYDHTVTKADVDNGYVENWALADYSVYEDDSSVTWYSAIAGPVYSPTCKNPVIKKKTPGTGKADSCKLTLAGVGSYTLAQEQHYCATHREVLDKVSELTGAAVTDAEKAEAWQTGVTLWREALEAEYDELMKACDGAARLTAMEEKTAFDKYLAGLNAMLQALYPNDAALVSRLLCTAIEKQCTELCYLGSNAGAARPDSMYSGSYEAIEGDTAAGKCALSMNKAHSGDVMFTVKLCEEHGKMLATSAYLMQGTANRTAAEDTFRRIRRVWQGGLDQATNVKYRAAEGDARTAVGAYRMAFDQLVEKHGDMLAQFYPANPEIVAEVISNMVRDQLLILCGIW